PWRRRSSRNVGLITCSILEGLKRIIFTTYHAKIGRKSILDYYENTVLPDSTSQTICWRSIEVLQMTINTGGSVLNWTAI
uniref:Uncharacterized protein n=1 Tax=Haemonchus contortus TaxID=6289 RepID=A0A7I5EEU9_HAECO